MFTTNKSEGSLISNQSGFASMVIGLVLIVVIGLMTVGFAQLARHEQQQALSHQLSTQAYYAAETGINDAVAAIKAGDITDTTVGVDTNQCMSITGSTSTGKVISAANQVSYSCVMINLKSDNLIFNMGADSSQSLVTDTVLSGPITSLDIAWNNDPNSVPTSSKNAIRPTLGAFDSMSTWNSPAVIQFSITPLGGGYNRNTLISSTYTAYLYPTSGSASGTYSGGSDSMIDGNCVSGSPTKCHALISGIVGSAPYLIHIVNLYTASSITVTPQAGLQFLSGKNSGQPTIDVTGKAKNVLKRERVRVHWDNGSSTLPNYALEAQNICKRFATKPSGTEYVGTNGATATVGPPGNDPACVLN